MHGEDFISEVALLDAPETPPHAWGRPIQKNKINADLRNTPTCMGKTDVYAFKPERNWKHPHMHGEDTIFLLLHSPKTETPPHAWGRQHKYMLLSPVGRNTPTCMGKTIPALYNNRAAVETPPHAWGRHHLFTLVYVKNRNTPTCMGKTSCERHKKPHL